MGSNATTWDVILHYWTVTMFVPAILLVIATLAMSPAWSTTRSDRRTSGRPTPCSRTAASGWSSAPSSTWRA